MTTFLSNRSIYESIICGIVLEVRERRRIATATSVDSVVSVDSVDFYPLFDRIDFRQNRQRLPLDTAATAIILLRSGGILVKI